jgi:hypothetical protein
MGMAELETDLRLLLARGVDASLPLIGDVRVQRARRAAAWIAAHELALRSRGLLSYGEKPGDLHLAPPLEEALAAALRARI